jgi:hypothetical protein
MRRDDDVASLDHDDQGESPDPFDPEASGSDPVERADELGPIADEDLLEAELSELDDDLIGDLDEWLGVLQDEFDLADDDDEFDDEAEMALLQELGIDLDSPDDRLENLGLGLGLNDDPHDDVAA